MEAILSEPLAVMDQYQALLHSSKWKADFINHRAKLFLDKSMELHHGMETSNKTINNCPMEAFGYHI